MIEIEEEEYHRVPAVNQSNTFEIFNLC